MDGRLTSYSASCVLLYITNTGLKGKGMQSRWIVPISKSEFQCKTFSNSSIEWLRSFLPILNEGKTLAL